MSLHAFLRSPFGAFLPLAVIGLAATWIIPTCARRDGPSQPESKPTSAPLATPPPPSSAFPPDRPALRPVAANPAFPRSPLADALNSPATTATDDLRAIGRMLALYRERFDAYPAFGDNAQLVNALAGANPHRIALLPRDAAAISPTSGELLDRWGTPYDFHAIARDALEIRSAGPDRELRTADDLVVPLGRPAAPAEAPGSVAR